MEHREIQAIVRVDFLSDSAAIQEGLRLGGVGVWRWKVDSDVLQWSENLESVHNLPEGSFDGSLSSFQKDLHPGDAEAVWQKIRASIETGQPYRTRYRTAPRPGVEMLWLEARGGIVATPDGTRFLTGVCLDVTDNVRGERELERRLSQQRAVASFGSFALTETGFQKILDEAVRTAADVLGVPLTKILQLSKSADHVVLRAGVGWSDGLVGRATVALDQHSQAGFTLASDGPVIVRDLETETRFVGAKLLRDHRVRSGMSVVIPGDDARPFGVFSIHSTDLRHFDQTDAEFLLSLANIVAAAARQVAAADHRMLLVREMSHRAGNMLQLVSTIATQTFSGEADTAVARKSFIERLNSLARANYLVARGGWTSTRFAELVEDAMKPFGDRVTMKGRDILLPPELCFDMGLVLHELATNSMKYGSLGMKTGTVALEWRYEGPPDSAGTFSFSWRDPAETRRNMAKGVGFGSRLMSALIERKWEGTIARGKGKGFEVTMNIPLRE